MSNAANNSSFTFLQQPKEQDSSQLQQIYMFDVDQAVVGRDRPERRMNKTGSVRYKIEGHRVSIIEVRFFG
jgi:hypothetical protein